MLEEELLNDVVIGLDKMPITQEMIDFQKNEGNFINELRTIFQDLAIDASTSIGGRWDKFKTKNLARLSDCLYKRFGIPFTINPWKIDPDDDDYFAASSTPTPDRKSVV